MDALTTPLNWQRVRLGDIATFLKGKGLSKNQVSPNAKHECILYGELFTHYDRVVINIKSFTNIYDNPILSLNNDVLMSGSAETPDILATASCILKKGVILGGDILIIRPNSNLLNGCFLAYCIVYDKNQVLSKVVGSTVYHLYAKDLKDFEIPLPPLNEQIAIANILSDVDRYLYSLRALILKKESVKKALSFELLSQRKRLKGFNQAWQRVRLGDICEFGNGGAYETLIVENGNFKLISLNSIDIDGNLKNTMKRVNFYDNSLKQDDIVMVLSDVAHGDFLGLCAVIPSNDYVLNQRMGRLRIRNDCINILFLRLYVNANQKYFKMQGQGSSQLNLSKKAIEDFEIPLPPLNEQIAIANILSGLDHEIISLKNKKRQFENIKKALNHDLMSAKIRVLNK
ncbi:restriction endonuclease subunit S [Helicobacter pylori]|uniref:restriction endonuclease subunit S n=3 Tax=Helicobacter pylori TaxID=210 RepID=UPI000BEAAFC9|nr:restriction endonuclease subunit S [Helicobacter pylori]PDW10345.1 restriction endonuclease subunit S [Helicobacter pylori]